MLADVMAPDEDAADMAFFMPDRLGQQIHKPVLGLVPEADRYRLERQRPAGGIDRVEPLVEALPFELRKTSRTLRPRKFRGPVSST
ncbi:hypothetical protein GCM10011529_06530 [Polymorphobacter glacialis]|uniref:Uncharacterized protein n=1 Tax=Sandarakinorhabdus glacialis TaxID=1614636 RepID=A0A916ZLK0_9SPHN|nr:hypothetical protein GCM10011529_06530 [Polymorphobacter glacialis]